MVSSMVKEVRLRPLGEVDEGRCWVLRVVERRPGEMAMVVVGPVVKDVQRVERRATGSREVVARVVKTRSRG